MIHIWTRLCPMASSRPSRNKDIANEKAMGPKIFIFISHEIKSLLEKFEKEKRNKNKKNCYELSILERNI